LEYVKEEHFNIKAIALQDLTSNYRKEDMRVCVLACV